MKFQRYLRELGRIFLLYLMIRGVSNLISLAQGKQASLWLAWMPLVIVVGGVLFIAGERLLDLIKQSGWLFKLYRFRTPANSTRIEHPPPAPGFFERLYLRIRPPKWCRTSDDELMIIYREQDKLLHEGIVAFGVIVQVNSALFEKGVFDAPAVVLYITEAEVDDPGLRLMEVAIELYSLKEAKHDDADEEKGKFARMLLDEMGRYFRVSLPASLSKGLDITYTTIMVHRKHLPFGYVTGSYFPLLIHQESRAAMILPARYWPDDMIADWTPQQPTAPLEAEPSV